MYLFLGRRCDTSLAGNDCNGKFGKFSCKLKQALLLIELLPLY